MKKGFFSIKAEHLSSAIWDNTYDAMIPHAKSIGFRTPATQYHMQNNNSAVSVAEDFLLNSRHTRYDRETQCSILGYLSPPGVVMVSLVGSEDNPQAQQFTLPKSVALTIELGEAILKRRSVRHYTGDACRFDYLATIIRASCGTVSEQTLSSLTGNTTTMRYRTVPSGGALYPVDLYIAALNVNNVKRGLYRYHPKKDMLIQMGDQSVVKQLLTTFSMPSEQMNYTKASAIFMLVGAPWRSMRKYGARGLRFVLHEAGAISQNIHLTATGLGLGSVDCASVYDDEMQEILKIDGRYNTLLHTMLIGMPE